MGYLCILCFGMNFVIITIARFSRARNGLNYARMHMVDRPEKRRYLRLGAQYNISCRIVGSTENNPYQGHTVNVSPGGMYFETDSDIFMQGNLITVELSIPPTSGLLEFGGKIAGFAKVLRTDSASGKYGVALQFCRPPKLCI